MTNNETVWTDWLKNPGTGECPAPEWAVQWKVKCADGNGTSMGITNIDWEIEHYDDDITHYRYSIPADLAWLAENVVCWPDSAKVVRLDADGEVCFRGGCGIWHDFFPLSADRIGTGTEYTHTQWLRTRQDLGLTNEHTEQNDTMKLAMGDYVNTYGMGWDEFTWIVDQFKKAGAPVGGNCLYVPEVGQTKNLLLWDGMSLHHTTDRNQGSKKRDVTGWMHAEWRLHCAEQVPVTDEEEQAWQEKEDERMNIIARNGNDGDHYSDAKDGDEPRPFLRSSFEEAHNKAHEIMKQAIHNQVKERLGLADGVDLRSDDDLRATTTSDGSTASYYELPPNATQLQHLISHRNMNAQVGEIFRSCYRYGEASHSDQLRDAKKMAFYANAEVERLEALK